MAQINGWVETTQTGKGHKAMQNIGIVGDRIVYMQVEARTTVDFDGPAADKQPVFDEWSEWLESQVATAPYRMKDYRMNSFAWVWMVSEQAFI